MKTPLIAAFALCSASLVGVALAQTKPTDATVVRTTAEAASPTDAQSLASTEEVGVTRRAYRAACERHQSHEFCECVTAGMAQVLMPAEMRIAARTIGERINAEGDAADTEMAPVGANSHDRIEHTEGHYSEVCAQFRR